MYRIVLKGIVSYWNVLCNTLILKCIVPYHIEIYCIVLKCIVSYRIISFADLIEENANKNKCFVWTSGMLKAGSGLLASWNNKCRICFLHVWREHVEEKQQHSSNCLPSSQVSVWGIVCLFVYLFLHLKMFIRTHHKMCGSCKPRRVLLLSDQYSDSGLCDIINHSLYDFISDILHLLC